MATTPELYEPQIAAARAAAWYQTPSAETKTAAEPTEPVKAPEAAIATEANEATEADGAIEATEATEAPEASKSTEAIEERSPSKVQSARILTLEAARTFLNDCGLLLFGPRSLGAPSPSLVEATRGEAMTSFTPAEAATARSLVARLVAEGSAVPLNLLGGSGDVPDFVVSTAAFPFVFTLRGDKGWKRPPETAGAAKVTTLALHVYEVLTERGALTVSQIVAEVGREVTDSAVTRALAELWAMLRVIPALQGGEGDTLWELTTARFLKAVKAGANAGQPTALSALISLYLGQVFLATEEEIAVFLSPLTARSRIRDVLHGLSAGRQLSEAVLEGKTVLFLPDSLPDFAAAANAAPNFGQERGDRSDLAPEAPSSETKSGIVPAPERIGRFEGGTSEAGRDRSFRGKPAARPGASRSDGFRGKSPRSNSRFSGSADARPRPDAGSPREGERPDRPARPFGDRGPRPSFSDRSPRPSFGDQREAGNDRPSFTRPWDEEKGKRPARGSFERPSGSRPSGTRPSRPSPSGVDRPREDSRPPRRDAGPGRPPFSNRERGGDRPSFRREGAAGPRPFPREQGSAPRPFRSSFSPDGGAPRGDRDDRGARPPQGESAGGGGFTRRQGGPEGGDRGDRSRPVRPAGDRPSGSFSPRKTFDRPPREGSGPRPSGGGFRPREERSGGSDRPGKPSAGGRPPFREGAGRPSNGDRPARSFGDRPARSSGDRPDGSFGDRPVRSFGGRPARDGAGEGGRSRPFADRGGFRPADRPSREPGGAGGGFSRGPGGPSRGGDRAGGSSNRGPGGFGRKPGGFGQGADRGKPEGNRPPPRPRPKDEA